MEYLKFRRYIYNSDNKKNSKIATFINFLSHSDKAVYKQMYLNFYSYFFQGKEMINEQLILQTENKRKRVLMCCHTLKSLKKTLFIDEIQNISKNGLPWEV